MQKKMNAVLASDLHASTAGFSDREANFQITNEMEEKQLYTLVKRVGTGDRSALSTLYNLTTPLLFSIARRTLSNVADAEEVMCDVYVQAWQTAAQYDVKRGSVKTWLVMICRSRAIDRYRRNESRAPGDVCDGDNPSGAFSADGTPDDLLHALQRGTAIHHAIEQLSPLRRRLLALAFFHGLSHKKIAATTDLALGTVKSHIRRALATLRKELEPTDTG
jgi:RNA polymerase sigma factor (sigma-70 family)